MKRLPRKVKVGSHTYTIVRKPTQEMRDPDTGEQLQGRCDFDNCRIDIQRRLHPDKLREVVLHEVLHACTYPNLVDKIDRDEAFVEMIAPNLANVLRENPKFVEFLLDQENERGIPGEVRERKEPEQAQPEQGTSREAPGTGRVF